MVQDFRVYHLHGLGSSCESTKATAVRELTESLGGEFNCFNFNYLKKGNNPWDVLKFLESNVRWDKPFILVGSSMGAYSWLDYLVNNKEVFENPNFKGGILITPPTTLFDNLDKWNPIFGKEKLFLRYGEDYVRSYPEVVKLMHWDLKFANYRLLTLAEEKIVSILAKRDSVVDNGPIYGLIKVAKKVNYYELDDEHPLKEKIGELKELLRELFKKFLS